MGAIEPVIVSEHRATRDGAAQWARCAGRDDLARALTQARERTLRLARAFERALGPTLRVPCTAELNPPLWELGHIGWFADWWITRFTECAKGEAADPLAGRSPARQAARGIDADALYNSSTVPHDSRWTLPLPGLAAVRADLDASLTDTLARLAEAPESDAGLYFFRLALFHEDMHAEAWVQMGQVLGIDVGEAPAPLPCCPAAALLVDAGAWTLGHATPGFAFDNERGQQRVQVDNFEIDALPVSWARFLPAVQAGAVPVPRYLKRKAQAWWVHRFGRWQPLDPHAPACHISAHEARAWCAWAGRRLPTEAEWEMAAHTARGFEWGQVWEWTASTFAPLPGFQPHPYRDYSAPWFDGRPVLKGASWATAARMRHPRYRNFFEAHRNDVLAGFRSVAA
jgi:iron(II)-dependent oxidoreductase